MNIKQLVFIKTALLIAIWSYIFDSLFVGQSVYDLIGGIAITLAVIAANIGLLAKTGEVAYQVLVAIASFVIAIYKFMLSPLMRDYRAREDNYKEIVKGLQKELSREK